MISLREQFAIQALQELASEFGNNTELSLEEINQSEDVADYLFDGDINLTEKQLEMIEASLMENNVTRRKRQLDIVTPRWPNKRLYYTFDASINVFGLTYRLFTPPAGSRFRTRTV
ncbi:hypothetical protein OSTOST_17051 [Ostertagia ostertagi]